MANRAKDVKTRPAGINDNFEIAVMNINHVVENNKTELEAKGLKIPDLSIALREGMILKAYDGGKMQDVER